MALGEWREWGWGVLWRSAETIVQCLLDDYSDVLITMITLRGLVLLKRLLKQALDHKVWIDLYFSFDITCIHNYLYCFVLITAPSNYCRKSGTHIWWPSMFLTHYKEKLPWKKSTVSKKGKWYGSRTDGKVQAKSMIICVWMPILAT